MRTDTTTHASLLARLTDPGDQSAWNVFCDRYGELIRNFARRRDLQSADADDVVQEVLLSLARAMPGFSYDSNKGKFRSYLKTATLRAIFRKNHQRRGEVRIGDVEEAICTAKVDSEAEAAWEAEWRQYHLRMAKRTIDAEFEKVDRDAFERYAIGGHNAQDVASALKIRVNRVYEAKSRIARRFRELINLQVKDEG